ncbi:hypothetical protein ABGB19_10750 [Mycobacterium sp. B14F4]|uniref:hypothetical protein n=1 Tax=Mycobacterium sp. B14F4 TaxID=3153565 RepID=UPI00325F7AE6
MQLAARSSFAAGVAVIGAGILVAAPVAPPMPDVPDARATVRSATAELSAFAKPLAALSPSLADASGSTGGVLGRSVLQPSVAAIPVLGQLPTLQELLEVASAFAAQFGTALSDAPAKIQLAVEQISAGQITAGLNTLVEMVIVPVTGPVLEAIFTGSGPLVDLVALLQRPFEGVPPISNVIGLLADPDFLLTIGLGPLQSVYALTTAIGGAAETMLAAVEAGDPGAFVTGLLKGVGDVTEAVIDRLLNPGTPPYGYDRGLFASLIEAGKMVFAALTAPAAAPNVAAVSAISTDAVTTVTLSTEPVSADVEAEIAEVSTPVEDEAPSAAATETAEEEVTVSPAVEPEAAEKPQVREGFVAVPGEVTEGVPDDESEDAVAETDPGTAGEAGSPAESPTSGQADGYDGSGDGGGAGDEGSSDDGGGSGDSE